MKRKAGKPLPLGDIIGGQIRSLGWERKMREMGVFEAWERIVGPAVAAHTAPLEVKNRRLSVAVESPAWSQQLAFLKRDILARIEEILGAGVIDDIYLTGSFSRKPDLPAEASRAFETVPLDAEAREAVEDAVAGIGDDGLRDALRKLLLTASCRKPSRRQ